jgi:DNA-binding LacI/PurR family transcriptional regulator
MASRDMPTSKETSAVQASDGTKRAGLVSVARALGVSPSTVSNAYNRPDQLSVALRERVFETAAELGYAGPDPVARNLRRGRAGAIGVVFAERLPYAFSDPAAALFLQGVSDVVDDEGLAAVLVPGPWGRPLREAAVRNAAVDGFIVHGLVADDPLLAATLARGRPTVIVDSDAVDGLDFVGVDDREGAETALRHLLELGHRELGVLSFQLAAYSPPRPTSVSRGPGDGGGVNEHRLQGCERAVEAAGLPWSGVQVETCAAIDVDEGRIAAHRLLDRAPLLTALFAFSDVLALGAQLAVEERGLSVPEDLSIIGFDDTAPAPRRLTTIRQPLLEKGRIAAECLIDALGTEPRSPRFEMLPTQLVIRGSTAAPRPR